jgi:hypothetical protein
MTSFVPGTKFVINVKSGAWHKTCHKYVGAINMRKNVRFTFFLIIYLLFFCSLSLLTVIAVPRYDPGLNWQVLESPHFSVYFAKSQDNEQNNRNFSYGNEQLARQIADIAEETYHQVNAQLGSPNKHHHLQKVAIIMEDFSDYALGFASSLPHRVIRLSRPFRSNTNSQCPPAHLVNRRISCLQ